MNEIATDSIRHRFIEANGIRFHVAEAGDGPPVLLLHGWPECWYSWRLTLPFLAEHGYRAIAPDMRGFNLSDKPKSGYDTVTLVADIVALIEAVGGPPMHLVGHDWGGIVAWHVAWRHPKLLRSLTVMNAPHPTAFARYLRRHPAQMLSAAHMIFFQLPWLPERLLTARRAAVLGPMIRHGAKRRHAITAADLDVYQEAMTRPGAARAGVEYYRQAFRQGNAPLPNTPITVPSLVLWGRDDPVLSVHLNDGISEWAPGAEVRLIDDCGHWTQQERPDVVHPALLAWIQAHENP